MSRAQISALVFGVGGFGALVAATASNEWKVTTRASSVITATWVYQGLWMNCAGNALGSFHCRPHFTIFKVEVIETGSTNHQKSFKDSYVKVDGVKESKTQTLQQQ
ncbi:claudin-18-like [Panthera leo]|uniref:claudin-18-like n=1 Tax=Panthera leo TaxID=9689 RepID=UPI001C6A3A99|nr:claudin-18-like [Panthera leo]